MDYEKPKFSVQPKGANAQKNYSEGYDLIDWRKEHTCDACGVTSKDVQLETDDGWLCDDANACSARGEGRDESARCGLDGVCTT